MPGKNTIREKRDDRDRDFEAGLGERGGKEACEKRPQRRHQRSRPAAANHHAGQDADCQTDDARRQRFAPTAAEYRRQRGADQSVGSDHKPGRTTERMSAELIDLGERATMINTAVGNRGRDLDKAGRSSKVNWTGFGTRNTDTCCGWESVPR